MIIDITVFLTNIREDFKIYNSVYAEYFKNQHILPFIDYHLIFYYLYYNDQGYFQQLEERMEENYLENSFKENYINYLKPIIYSMKTNELLNENIIKSQFKYLGGSFAQRELIFLSLIQKLNKK